MPGLTAAALIVFIILITLGTWQYQRLQWKTALLADVDHVTEAAPLTSFLQVQETLETGAPIDFQRIGITAKLKPIDSPFFVFTAQNRDISWRVFSPVLNDGVTAFAALAVVNDTDRESVTALSGEESVVGYVRLARDDDGAHNKSSPEQNRWFGFNPLPSTHNWANALSGGADMRFYIDRVSGVMDAELLPPRRPDIRNNHFDYMLTWYGLALTLLVIYLIMHRRVGRLSFS